MQEKVKRPYHRARAICTNHILCCDYSPIFKGDVTELRILPIATQSDHLQRSMDSDPKAGQLLLECTLSEVLGNDENVWVSSV